MRNQACQPQAGIDFSIQICSAPLHKFTRSDIHSSKLNFITILNSLINVSSSDFEARKIVSRTLSKSLLYWQKKTAMKIYYVYILKCSDNSYYTGITSNLEKRFFEHESGKHPESYTFKRRPLEMSFYAEFTNVEFAIDKEKQIKKWSRAKKEALINGDFDSLPNLARKKFK